MGVTAARALIVLALVATACGDSEPEVATSAVPQSTVAEATSSTTTVAPSSTTTTAPSSTTTTASPPVMVERDIQYAVALDKLAAVDRTLDVYSPVASDTVVVLLHGSGASKDNTKVVAVAMQLASAGVEVVVPDHAGTGAPETVLAGGGRRGREALETTACAIRFASERAAGRPVVVVGHSAGGLFGSLVALGSDRVAVAWQSYGEARGLAPQSDCVVADELSADISFVGYNGALFVFQQSGIAESDPELYALVNPRHFVEPGSGRLRFIIGGNDQATPAWHTDEVRSFVEELNVLGYESDVVEIAEAPHDWITSGPVWEATLAAILEVAAPQ